MPNTKIKFNIRFRGKCVIKQLWNGNDEREVIDLNPFGYVGFEWIDS